MLRKAVSIISIVIALSGFVNSDFCPAPEDIQPCYCNPSKVPINITCAKVTNTIDLYDVFDRTGNSPFTLFTLRDSEIMYLPASSVMQKQMMSITILDSSLTSIFEAQPDPANSLMQMKLWNVRLMRGVTWDFFRSFGKLRWLNVSRVEIRTLGQTFQDNVSKDLQYLILDRAKVTTIEDGVFANFNKLLIIEITNSQIKTLKRTMFPNFWPLAEFNFRGNKIEDLPDNIFRNMPVVSKISLDDNELKTLPANVFREIYNREMPKCLITLRGNPVMCDCSVKWIVEPLDRVNKLDGTCAAPPSKKDLAFSFLTKHDFSQCLD